MPNMSYCRFSNTVNDLWDCYNNWSDDDLSDGEKKAQKQLLALCKRIVAENDENDDEEESDVA